MAACSPKKHQRESDDTPKFNVFTGWLDFRVEVSDSSSLPCRKDAKILLQPSNLAENCTCFQKTIGLRRWVRKSDLQPWSNLRMLWVLEEENQHDVTCYNSKGMIKKRSYHGRSTFFKVFNAAPRVQSSVRPGPRAACSSKKHQRESDDTPKFNVFTGWLDFRVEVSDSSSLPCRKDAKILLQPSNLAENLHVCSEDHRNAALSGEVGPSTLEQLKNALSAWRREPTWCNML